MPITCVVRGAWCVGLLLAVAACHRGGAGVQTIEPETLFRQTMEAYRRGSWQRAQVGLTRLQFELALRDTLMPKVRFYLAETHSGLGDAIAAAREFRRVADDFPSDALAPTALLRAGDQYARMWRRAELDPSHGETAMATWQELIGRYADTPAARLAEVRVRTLQEQFAQKDFENAGFYLKRGAYDSAILYFTGMIAKYPSSPRVPEAFVALVQAYRAIGYREELDEKCAHLRRYFGNRADVRRECGSGDGTAGR